VTIRINGSVSGRRVDLVIDGVSLAADSTDLRAFVQNLEDGQLSIFAHHLRQRMEERGFAWNPRTETPAEREQRDGGPSVPIAINEGQGWRSPGGAGQWNG
jgi:acylphosphatase